MSESKPSLTPAKILTRYPPTRSESKWIGFGCGMLLSFVLVGAYAGLRWEAATTYKDYAAAWMRNGAQSMTARFQKKQSKALSLDQLRYRLWHEGNLHHQYDAALLQHRMYPAGVPNPQQYIAQQEQFKPLYWFNPLIEGLIALGLFSLPLPFGFAIGGKRDQNYNEQILIGYHISGAMQVDMPTYRKFNRDAAGDPAQGLALVFKVRSGGSGVIWE